MILFSRAYEQAVHFVWPAQRKILKSVWRQKTTNPKSEKEKEKKKSLGNAKSKKKKKKKNSFEQILFLFSKSQNQPLPLGMHVCVVPRRGCVKVKEENSASPTNQQVSCFRGRMLQRKRLRMNFASWHLLDLQEQRSGSSKTRIPHCATSVGNCRRIFILFECKIILPEFNL
jgi:hypothetical protein